MTRECVHAVADAVDIAIADALALSEVFVARVDVFALAVNVVIIINGEKSINQLFELCRKAGRSNPKFVRSKMFRF